MYRSVKRVWKPSWNPDAFNFARNEPYVAGDSDKTRGGDTLSSTGTRCSYYYKHKFTKKFHLNRTYTLSADTPLREKEFVIQL